jgi:hypothetical protein
MRRREARDQRSRRVGASERLDLDVDGCARILVGDKPCLPGLRESNRRSVGRADDLVPHDDPRHLDDDVQQRNDPPHGLALHADDELRWRLPLASARGERDENGDGAKASGTEEAHGRGPH